MSRVLLVGGAGYVGSAMAEQLLGRGYEVEVYDSLLWGSGHCLLSVAEHPRFSFTCGDVRDRPAVAQAVSRADDVVVLAGLVGDPITAKYPEQSRSVNVDGIGLVVREALSYPVRRLIFVSTCSNYGLQVGDALADEQTPLSPVSMYSRQKIAIEQELLDRCPLSATDIVILRFVTAFGLSPRMRLDLTISHFAKDAVSGGSIEIYDADTWRPYCHVADFSDAVAVVLEADRSLVRGEVFNVGSTAENYTKRHLGEMVRQLRPSTALIFREGGGDARNYRVSFDKIADCLGFVPYRGVRAHLPKLLEFMETGIVPVSDESALQAMGNYVLPPSEV